MNARELLWSSAIGLLAATGCAQVASAQAAPPPTTDTVGEVVVTARRQAENLQTTPVAVTAVTPRDIQERGILNIQDVAKVTPNMAIRPNLIGKYTPQVTIRGQVQQDALITLDPSVGVYVDDVYVARAYSALSDLLDVAGVEVLKGPQGTLYGRNTTGGAIKITTQEPSLLDYTGYVKVGHGNFEQWDAEGAVSIPIIKDVLGIRYAAAHHEHAGYTHTYVVNQLPAFPSIPVAFGAVLGGAHADLTPVREVNSDDRSSDDQRLTILWRPTEKLKFTLTGSTFRAKDNGMLSVNIYGDIGSLNLPGFLTNGLAARPLDFFTTSPQRKADFYSALSPVAPVTSTNNSSATLTSDYQITDNLDTKLIVSYMRSHNLTITNAAGIVTPTIAFIQFEPEIHASQRQFSGEWQVSGHALDRRLNWIGGLYYFKENGEEDQPANTRILGSNATSVRFHGEAENTSRSAYGSVTYKWTDRWSTSGGIRYTEDQKGVLGLNRTHADVCVYGPGPGIITSTTPGGPCALDRTDKFTNTSWELSTDYQFTDNLYGYVKVNTAYRSGGEQIRAVDPVSAQPFEPEKVLNFEGGLKAELFDRRVRLNGAIFHTNYRDIQLSRVVSPPVVPTVTLIVRNGGKATVDGFELETVARVTHNLTLQAAAGYTNFAFDDPTLHQINTPKWTADASAIYEFPVSVGDVSLRIDYSFTGSQYNDQAKASYSYVPSYSLLNARAALTLTNRVELALWARNLTDRQYFVGGNHSSDLLAFGVGAPRTYGAEVSYHW